jgi:hypothetical protein
MRTKKELIEICIENLNEKTLEDSGLCNYPLVLYSLHLISFQETLILQDLIKSNTPFFYKLGFIVISPYCPYWWERGKVKPRLKFLNKLLKKY